MYPSTQCARKDEAALTSVQAAVHVLYVCVRTLELSLVLFIGRDKRTEYPTAVESPTWHLNSHNCSENYSKTKTKLKKFYDRNSYILE